MKTIYTLRKMRNGATRFFPGRYIFTFSVGRKIARVCADNPTDARKLLSGRFHYKVIGKTLITDKDSYLLGK